MPGKYRGILSCLPQVFWITLYSGYPALFQHARDVSHIHHEFLYQD